MGLRDPRALHCVQTTTPQVVVCTTRVHFRLFEIRDRFGDRCDDQRVRPLPSMTWLGLIVWLTIPCALAARSSEEATSTKTDGGASAAATGARATASSKPPASDKPAEVEISGTLKISERPARLFVFVSRKPCDARLVSEDIIGSVKIDPFVSTNFFIEVFVPQGSRGNVCGAGRKGQRHRVGRAQKESAHVPRRGRGDVRQRDHPAAAARQAVSRTRAVQALIKRRTEPNARRTAG